MATKAKTRKKTTHHKPKAGAAQMHHAKTAVAKRKKKRTPKHKNMLSEIVSTERAMKSGSSMLSGFVGGSAVQGAMHLAPTSWGNGARVLTGLLLSFTSAVAFDMQNVAAGASGATAYMIWDKKMLNDDGDDNEEMEETEFTDEDVLEEMPMFLNENGYPMVQNANGELVALSEEQYIKLQESGEIKGGRVQYYAPYNQQY